jgi:hypothetical protein
MRSRIAFVCTVWGAEFTDFFCQYCLATLLSPGNLPRASAVYDFTLLLYTSEDDFVRMREHRNFRKLATLINIRTVFIETLPPGARHGHWIQWHHALLSSDEFSSFILLIPDCLYANEAIEEIAKSVEVHDIVYYCIPQICIEPVLPHLASLTRTVEDENPYVFLDFSALDIASLFVKYVTPRYAVALDNPDYFVTHPEFLLHVEKGQVHIHEMTCHALAVSSQAKSLSYTFNPASTSAKIGFLELLAVGVEYTLKYFEQYYHWSSSRMLPSRFTSLASWSYSFAGLGQDEYSKTKTHIAVSGLTATALQRATVTSPRANYARISLFYRAAFYAIYSGPAGNCRPEIRQALALAMCLPGFRKALMRTGRPFTVVLPVSEDASTILDHVYRLTDRKQFFAFLLMHVIPGRLMLKVGQTFVFERVAGQPASRPRLRVVEPELTNSLTDIVAGQVASQPTYVTEDVITYTATIRYGSASDFIEAHLV